MNTPITKSPIAVISIPSFKIQISLKNPVSTKPYPNRFRISTTNVAFSNANPSRCISAQFGGESKYKGRRNYLREKILEKQKQVGSADLVDSSEKKYEVFETVNVRNFVDEVTEFLSEEERLKLVKDSVLLSKLESWADQYNKDVKLWGVGSSPIFTVFEDLNGNVERVLVNEDEIRARGGLEEDGKELNLRILHASWLGKELESGKHVIPRNSTVAKFVVQGESGGVKGVKIAKVKKLDDVKVKDEVIMNNFQFVSSNEESSFVSTVRTAVFRPGVYPKLSKFGIVGFCGLLVLWAAKSVITVGQRSKLMILGEGKNEEEMKEKGELVKGCVEVVNDLSQAQKVCIRRPKLDKQELLKKMSKNKRPTDGNIQLLPLSASEGTETLKLEETISDIRKTATPDGEVEEKSSSLLADGEDLYAGVRNTKIVDLNINEAPVLLNFHDKTSKKAEADFVGESTNLEGSPVEVDVNKINFADCDAIETGSPSVDVILNDSDTTTGDDLCVKKPDEVLALVQDEENFEAEPLVWTGANHPTSQPSEIKRVAKQSAPRKKVRIMKSVKEAREYLSRKSEKPEPLHNSEDILSKEGASSSWLKAETLTTGIIIHKTVNSPSDLSQSNSGLPDPVSSTGMIWDSQLNKKTDHKTKNDTGEYDGSAVSHEHGWRLMTTMDNQEPHENDEGIPNRNNSVSWAQIGSNNSCTVTGHSENYTDFSQDNIDPIFNSRDHAEQIDESQPVGKENPDSNGDLDNIQQSVIFPKSKDPENIYSAASAIREPPNDHGDILCQGSSNSDIKIEDESNDSTNVRHDGKPTQIDYCDSAEKEKENKPAKDVNRKDATAETNQAPTLSSESETPGNSGYWLEKNFHVLDPVVAKIRDGFRENYMVAQEKAEEAGTISHLSQLEPGEDDHELEWMKDDHLRDIVFKVRDNELSGREPFHLMSKEDEAAFFEGLQKKVEQENKKLSKVHEYIHLNVENLDYGADGISIYDPPEKVIPRWKGPPIEKAPQFLSNSVEQKGTMVNGNVNSPLSEQIRATSPIKMGNRAAKKPKIIIEGSDGSVKPGKKNGKEFWQHTKKWSRGFLELYNAETDPEVKAAMRDMGKDLDRWITEEEIQEAAEWIEKMPERNKEFIQKKVQKIKREMELFGPQAVVRKYKEYSEEKEEDYLWWLDLPYVLCIEMYTNEGEEQRVGFYSLEMATDLELDPKPCHVIAFEDSKDCKNMCYIIQSHLEMLRSGLAFVVARPPKDTFRESKANGYNVTVIRRGELSLNIDQMLEEVEEQIVEIGSKMYHDQIMKDRSVDMNALMKGVIGDTKPIRRKLARRKLKNISTNKQ